NPASRHLRASYRRLLPVRCIVELRPGGRTDTAADGAAPAARPALLGRPLPNPATSPSTSTNARSSIGVSNEVLLGLP
ncbi:MAG: hypothetical protein ACXVRK_05895, partial [Gaiellaceae bacterium]